MFLLLLLVVSVGAFENPYAEIFQLSQPKPGPWIEQTHGKIWPKPQTENPGQGYLVIDPYNFEFLLSPDAQSCDILSTAVKRYYRRTFIHQKANKLPFDSNHPHYSNVKNDPEFKGVAHQVEIVMNNRRGCKEKYPTLNMDEHYELKINSPDEPGRIRIIAFSAWGILRGMESFSQLVLVKAETAVYIIKSTQIMDFPRYTHRGVMLDSARHFLSMKVILDNLDLMEMNKFNVFHWHLVDDQSFPYESIQFPNLSLKGAYRPYTHVYSQEDIRTVIEEARLRGIRVIPEFDTPGHTQSWELGHPGLLTPCYAGDLKTNDFGPMDPTKESLFSFLKEFFKEIITVFPDKYVHLGGDEVSLNCWETNPDVQKFVREKGWTDYRKLESYYFQKFLNIIASYPTDNGYIVWEEVFSNGDKVKNDTVIQVWKGGQSGWQSTVAKATAHRLQVILSAPWYLNYISYGSDWPKYYNVDPAQFSGTDQQKRLVLGGEACIWGEFVNSVNLLPRLWPRASAVAERLWSSAADTRSHEEAAPRIQEMECRLLQRGYPVEPINGPGFCDVNLLSPLLNM